MQDIKYKPLTLPEVIWEKNKVTDTKAELIAQPLEPGFGLRLVMHYVELSCLLLKELR